MQSTQTDTLLFQEILLKAKEKQALLEQFKFKKFQICGMVKNSVINVVFTRNLRFWVWDGLNMAETKK